MANNRRINSVPGVHHIPIENEPFEKVWTSDNVYTGRYQGESMDPEVLKVINANSSLAFTEGQEGQEVGWRKARASTFIRNSPQQILEELDSVKLNRDMFLMLDFEALGTLTPQRGDRIKGASPTELAMQLTRITTNNKGGYRTQIIDELNMLIHPGQYGKKWSELLDTVERGGIRAASRLSDDERRTLRDLILYSDASQIEERTIYGRRIKTLKAQARDAQPIGMASLANKTTVQKMRQGLHNLLNNSTDVDTARVVASTFIEQAINKTKGTIRLGGHNIKNYDIPMMGQLLRTGNETVTQKALDFLKSAKVYDSLEAETTLNRSITSRFRNLQLLTIAQTRGVLEKKGRYLEGGGAVRAHYAPADVEMNARVIADQVINYNRMKKDGRTQQEILRSHRYIEVDTTPLKVGDRLFAISGIQGFNAGPYDTVYGSDRAPITTMRGSNPLYRNSIYTIKNFGVEAEIGGVQMYTMSLFNENRGTTHFFARESIHELRDIIHKNMEYIGDPSSVFDTNNPYMRLAESSIEDAAMRRYNKMFSNEIGGGINLYTRFERALEAYQQNAGKAQSEIEQAIKGVAGYEHDGKYYTASDAFVRDFFKIKDRFQEEKPYLEKFIKDLNDDPLFRDRTGAKNLALSYFKEELDDRFGRNIVNQEVHQGVRAILPLQVGNETFNIQVSDDIDAVRSSLNRAIRSGHTSAMSNHAIKTRMLQVITQLRAKDYINPTHAKDLYRRIQSITDEETFMYAMRDLSLVLNDARIKNREGIFGLKTIDVESPTRLIDSRREGLSSRFDKEYSSIFQNVRQRVSPLISSSYDGLSFDPTGSFARRIQEHDSVMSRLYTNPAFSDANIARPRSAKQVLDNLVRRYTSGGQTGATLFYGGRDEVIMAVYDKALAQQVQGMSFEEIMSNNRIVTMHIPLLKENQNLRFGTSERIGRVRLGQLSDGSINMVTGFEEVVNLYSNMSKSVIDDVMAGEAIQRTRSLRSVANSMLESLSQNRMKSSRDRYSNPFDVHPSRAANWLRQGSADFSDLAEMWFKQKYYASHPDVYERIKKRAIEQRMTFEEAMDNVVIDNVDGRRVQLGMHWSLDMEDWLRENRINVSAHSIKNVLVNNSVRSFNDVGELTAFGMFNPGAREKHFKVMNYLPLDRGITERALRKAGFSTADIQRTMGMGVTTGRALEVLGDEVNFLSLRTAHMNSDMLASMLGDLEGSAKYSTYDGMFMLRKSLAGAFTTTETKNVRLSDGAVLQEGLAHVLGAEPGAAIDLTQDIILDQPRTLAQALQAGHIELDTRRGRITVGGMIKETLTEHGAPQRSFIATDFFEDKNIRLAAHYLKTDPKGKGAQKAFELLDRYTIRGWSGETGSLILEQTRELETGDKMLGIGGQRITVTLVEDSHMDRIGKGIQAVMPNINVLDHRDYGALLSGVTNLAYDEMYKQYTAKNVGIEVGFQTLRNLMTQHLGISPNDIRIEKDKIILNEMLGIDGLRISPAQVESFLDAVNQDLHRVTGDTSIDLLNRQGGYLITQTGLAVSSTPKWHDETGRLALHQRGLVRWGLKEFDMINDRLERMGHAGFQTSAIHRWLNVLDPSAADLTDNVQMRMIAQSPEGQRTINAITRTLMTEAGADQIRPGEVIIRTQATMGDFGPSNEGGRSYAYVDDRGVIHVSGDNFADIPSVSQKGGFLTVQDLNRTIITAHQSTLPVGSVDSQRTLGQAILDNHGTALVELPEGTGRKYMRFISTEIMPGIGAGERAVMDELQRLEVRIWSDVRSIGTGGGEGFDYDKAIARLNSNIEEYHQKAAHILRSSRDSSISKSRMSVLQDMSGRFHAQGVNPAAALQHGYQEATVYLGRDRVARMIAGSELEIAETLGLDLSKVNLESDRAKFTVQKMVLDAIERDGIYGFVGRYPTNSMDTINVHKIMIDSRNVAPDYAGARITAATAKKMLADYDGDHLNIVLSHYGIKDRQLREQLHRELQAIQQFEMREIERVFQGKYAEGFDGDRNYTVSDLAKREVLGPWDQAWEAQRGGNYDLESTVARVNASVIGRADNIRLKIWNLADDTFDILARNNLIGAEEALALKQDMQEFGRRFSQQLISSKQFNVDSAVQALQERGVEISGRHDPLVREEIMRRQTAIADFIAGVSRPDSVGVEQIRRANETLGMMFSDQELGRMVDTVQKLHRIYGSEFLTNESLNIAVSEGQARQLGGQLFTGRAGRVVSTPWIENYLRDLDETSPDLQRVARSIREGMQHNENLVVAAWDRLHGDSLNFTAEATSLGEEMLGRTAAESTGSRLRELSSQVFGGAHGRGLLTRQTFGIAGAVFGGMWAASTLVNAAPTPEGNQAQQEAQATPVPGTMMKGPTARITQNPSTEDITIRISGRDAAGLSSDQISALIQAELNAMMPMTVNMNMNVNDNTQNIDRQWLQGVMANAINHGFAFN